MSALYFATQTVSVTLLIWIEVIAIINQSRIYTLLIPMVDSLRITFRTLITF